MIQRIILEGVDNTGKSTVAQMLKEKLIDRKVEIKHFTGPPKGTSQRSNFNWALTDLTIKMLDDPSYLVITDRDIYGEMVYGPMYRKEDPNWIWELEENYKDLTESSFFVLLEDTAKNSLSRDDGKSFTTNRIKRYLEIRKFRKAIHKSTIPYRLIVKITDMSPEWVTEEILSKMRLAEEMNNAEY